MLAGFLMGLSVMAVSGELYQGQYVEPYKLISPGTLEWLVPLYGLLIGFSVALAGSPAGVKVFGEEKVVYWREASAGHSQSAYYLGKTLAALPRIIISSFHFTGMVLVGLSRVAINVFFGVPAFPRFPIMFQIVLGMFFGIYGISAFVSTLVNRENGNLLAVIIAILYHYSFLFHLVMLRSVDSALH
jgi:hypothetical protein